MVSPSKTGNFTREPKMLPSHCFRNHREWFLWRTTAWEERCSELLSNYDPLISRPTTCTSLKMKNSTGPLLREVPYLYKISLHETHWVVTVRICETGKYKDSVLFFYPFFTKKAISQKKLSFYSFL